MKRALALTTALIGATSSMAARIDVPVTAFSFTQQGGYVHKLDRRDLFQIIHFWAPAKAGDFGQMETLVTLPDDSRPPYTLVFYAMDNNYTGPEETGADWINRDVRLGHRLRQVLVNGEVVWEQDTGLDDESQHYLVDLGERVQSGDTFRLAFRLWDAVDSDVTLPGDVYVTQYYAENVATATKKPEKDRHETKSYWGDVAIYTGETPRPEDIPWGGGVTIRAPKPEPHRVSAAVEETVRLKLEHAELLDGPWPWPVVQGIPFVQGAVRDPAHIALQEPGGGPVPTQRGVMNSWPDDSMKWCGVAFTLPPKSRGDYQLAYGSAVRQDAVAPDRPITLLEGRVTAANGLVRLAAAVDQGAMVGHGDAGSISLHPYLRAGGRRYHAEWHEVGWLVRSAQLAEGTLAGDLVAADGDRYGTVRLRLGVFAGCPYVRVLYRIENQREEKTFSTEAYGLQLETPAITAHESGDRWAAIKTADGALAAVGRWFPQQWPNGFAVGEDTLDIQCFRPGDARLPTYDTHPGEAKTHEIWLALTPEAPTPADCNRLAALVDTPPRLDISGLIRESRVWGELPEITPASHSEVYAKVQEVLAPYAEKCKESIRLFGEYGNWDNYYWNTLHTLHCLYAMTGERRWLDWVERAVRHHFDVDICHWQPQEGAVGTVGAIHGYWGDHSDTPCYSLVQNCDGAFDHWNLTGDPEACGYGRGIAEYVRTSESIGRGGSTREQGWPVICMLAAWRQTGETKYLDHAKLLVETALGFEERRRGTYIENHGSVSYLGPTPFMYGILCTALRQYHLATGDDRAAVLIARLSNAVYEEAHDPWHSKTLPSIDYYYSPNPYLRGGDGFTPITTLNLNIAAAQAYGAWVTQDPGLADVARKSWQAGLEGGSVYMEMAYDLAGVVWWTDRLAE